MQKFKSLAPPFPRVCIMVKGIRFKFNMSSRAITKHSVIFLFYQSIFLATFSFSISQFFSGIYSFGDNLCHSYIFIIRYQPNNVACLVFYVQYFCLANFLTGRLTIFFQVIPNRGFKYLIYHIFCVFFQDIL